MSNKIKIIFAVAILFFLASCSSRAAFTAAERKFILSGGANEPFRVLQITDRTDSLTLRAVCSDLHRYENDTVFRHFVSRLNTTLQAAGGVGIAASQVGIKRNVFLFMRIDKAGEPIAAAINPRITATPDTAVCFERDGCLSIPDVSGNSERYAWVDVEYLNEKGEKITEKLQGYSRQSDFTGIIFQHEYDHTRGVLFIDKLCN